MLRIGGHYHARLGREPERQCCQRGVPVRIGASTPAIGGLFAAPDKRSDAHACIDHDFLLTPCSQDIMAKNGFTTTIVHSDRRSSVEHGAIHKPMPPSSEYAFADARELTAVFQGTAGFTSARRSEERRVGKESV